MSEFDDMVSAALGAGEFPRPVDWSALSGAERRTELRRLWRWVTALVRTWPVSRDVVPPCWYRHESLIRILSALRDACLTAYHATQAASAAADWMQVWDATEERMRRWVARAGCKSGEHHADRIQRRTTTSLATPRTAHDSRPNPAAGAHPGTTNRMGGTWRDQRHHDGGHGQHRTTR